MLAYYLETNVHISFSHLMPATIVCLLRFEITSKIPFSLLSYNKGFYPLLLDIFKIQRKLDSLFNSSFL